MFGLLLVMTSAVRGQMLVPEGQPGENYQAAYPLTMSVDGNLADWSQLPFALVNTGPIMPVSAEGNGAVRFAAAADDNFLYIAAQVEDARIVTNQHGVEYWHEDSLEIYINASGDPNLTSYTTAVAQITIPAANIGRSADQTIFTGRNFEQVGTRAVVTSAPGGYVVEAAIPLQNALWNIMPVGAIGFNIQLNSASQLERDLKLNWSNADQTSDQSYQNPSVFGELIFTLFAGQVQPTVIQPTAIPPTATPPPAPNAGFTVRGSQIIDPNGNVFVANGTNVSGYNWVWERRTVDDVSLIVDCWNFNLIRVNSFLFTGEVPWTQYQNNNNLDEIVQAYTSRGVVVVMEAHDRIGSYYQGGELTSLVTWFSELATRYRDNPYVWFDIMNEPGSRTSIDSNQWINMHGQVIQAIRGVGADNIIIVEGAYGGQDANNADANNVSDSAILQYGANLLNYNGQTYGNIVFSIHPYDLWNHGDAKMADFFDRVLGMGYALIIGEYGVDTGQNTQAATQSVFNTAPSRGIGRIVWHWDGGDNNDLTVNTSRGGGWEINDCTNPTNLSWLGQLVWTDNHQ